MNKSEIVTKIATELEITKALAGHMLDCFVDAVHENIRKDGIRLSELGIFGAKKRKARVGRNPKTGEEIKIPSKWAVTFRASSALKSAAAKK